MALNIIGLVWLINVLYLSIRFCDGISGLIVLISFAVLVYFPAIFYYHKTFKLLADPEKAKKVVENKLKMLNNLKILKKKKEPVEKNAGLSEEDIMNWDKL